MKWWPFKRERDPEEAPVSPETKAILSRADRLVSRVDAMGIETRAVAREAQHVRESNHFGPALIAAFSTPRRNP